MFERFAAATRRALVEAQAEARDLGHHFIGTQHLVLGLLTPDPGTNEPTRAMLLATGLDLDQARRAVAEADARSFSAPIIGTIPFTPRSKKVLELALREAIHAGSKDIQPHHLLLAILREGSGKGCKLLSDYDVTYDAVKAWATSPSIVRPGARTMPFRPQRGFEPSTPGTRRAVALAHQLAGGPAFPLATQHLLLGLIEEGDGLAAGVLASLGVTKEAVEAKIAELGEAGTSDAPPATHVKVGDTVDVPIDDPDLVRLLAHADSEAVGDVIRRALIEHLGPQA